jgi:aspartyl/asparaginyl beta-hydroxylase (cupin superfamily)|tara:strand:+ start:344 stop:577 length:234 start_codon:yes stop_codon:yes gene_type:complete
MSGVTLTGAQIDVFRAQTILRGLYMEAKHNMRLTANAPTCYSLAKKEFGLKGNKVKVYHDLAEMFVKAGIVEDYKKI